MGHLLCTSGKALFLGIVFPWCTLTDSQYNSSSRDNNYVLIPPRGNQQERSFCKRQWSEKTNKPATKSSEEDTAASAEKAAIVDGGVAELYE